MESLSKLVALSQPGTLRFEEQEGEWLASTWRTGAPKTEGRLIARGETIEEAAQSLLRKLNRKA